MPAAKKDKEGSRARILDGAAEEFAAHGFAGARIDRIARRTKLNVRMIYYHFGSKKGVYRAVLESIYEQAARILDATEDAKDPTSAALDRYVDVLTANPRFADVVVRELLDGAKHLRAMFKERPKLFRDVHLHARELLGRAVEQGLLRDQDRAMTVLALTASVCFLTAIRGSHALFLDGRHPTADEFKRHLFGILFEGLRKR
jgi:AcrR family transcriptional regulator